MKYTQEQILEIAYATVTRAAAKQVETEKGLFAFIAEQAAFIAAILADVPERSLEKVLSMIQRSEESEIDPDPELTAAMIAYFRREARHGRRELLGDS